MGLENLEILWMVMYEYLVRNERSVLKSKDSLPILPHRPRVCCHTKQTQTHVTRHTGHMTIM